jgi:Protein of unknown function (DUF3300)
MMKIFRMLAAAGCGSLRPWLERVAGGVVLLAFAMNAVAQAPAAPGSVAPPLSAEALDKLVGPIALYPDDLVAIILPASTNPLQLVQADRYLDKRKADPKLPVDDKWDDAVKSLLNYPDVVKMMSADLDWTTALGEAVVADQGAVLEGIQSFRRRAQAAGNLKSDGKQVVEVQKEIITIVPADPQVIYVPQYNPTTVVVYGAAPVWGYYPTPYPSYYYPYPPGAAMAAGVIWGAAIGAAWSGNHYGANYHGDANINVNRNTNINTGNINRGGGARQQPAGGGTAWKPNKQPGQVSGSVGRTASAARPGDARAGAGGYGSAGGGAGRATAQSTGGGAGRASAQAGGATSGGSAFSGYGSGRQTQMDSSRGASSRSSMSGASARPTSSGGARAGGGGGGGGRGGGGGGRGGGRR